MTKFYTHKITGSKLELKKNFGAISSLFLLDENLSRIKRKNLDVKGNVSYEVVACDNKNLIPTEKESLQLEIQF